MKKNKAVFIAIVAFTLAVLILTFGVWFGLQEDNPRCRVVRDIDLGNANPDTFDGTLMVDIYSCGDAKAIMPMAVGGAVERSSYSEFANKMAARGYTTIVMEVRVDVFGQRVSLVQPHDFQQVIDYATVHGLPAEQVVLFGHSVGGTRVLLALTELCAAFPFFCGTTEEPFSTVPLSPSVLAAAAYGTSIVDPRTGQAADALTNVGMSSNRSIPFLTFVGDGDINAGDLGDLSFENYEPPKAYLEAENMDHFSITDQDNTTSSIGEVQSTLPQGEQIDRVAETTADWFDFILNKRHLDGANYCSEAVSIPVLECIVDF